MQPLPEGVDPRTFALLGAFDPMLSEGALKPPEFHTSTFIAETAEQLEHWFCQAYGLGMDMQNPDGLMYTRVVNPTIEIFENRIAVVEGGEAASLFASGMAAISTTCFAHLRPGDTLVFSEPVYGGTDYLFRKILPLFGIKTVGFSARMGTEAFLKVISGLENVKMVYMESPDNPTLTLVDVPGISRVAKQVFGPDCVVVVDSTVLGPVLQKVLDKGADIALYSATKSIGGHSDLIGGLAISSQQHITLLKAFRTILGTVIGVHTAWMLLRSLETLHWRIEGMQANARRVAKFLYDHPAVERVFYPGFNRGSEQTRRFEEQCVGGGSLMSFTVKGGKENTFKVLNALRVIRLAVSLGGTVSLAEAPAWHTHSDVSEEDRDRIRITPNMIRLSVGGEAIEDLLQDLGRALATIS